MSDGSKHIGHTGIRVQNIFPYHWRRIVYREELQIIHQVEEAKCRDATIRGEAHSRGALTVLQRLIGQTGIHHDHLIFIELEAVQRLHSPEAIRSSIELLVNAQAGVAAAVDVPGQIGDGLDT